MCIIVDRTAKYKVVHVGLLSCSVTMAFMTIYALNLGDKLFLTICIMLFGVFGVAVRPVTLSYGIELTFPMQPASTNGLMCFFANISALIVSCIVTILADGGQTSSEIDEEVRKDRVLIAMRLLASLLGIALLAAVFIKEDLRRLNYKK